MINRIKHILIAFMIIIGWQSASAILTPQVDSIPMSDGRKLAADVYIPQGMTQGPVILIQTPYNRQFYRLVGLPLGIRMNVDSSKYIYVIVDWRGFYGSAAAKYPGSPDNGTDGFHVVEWIAQQSWSNGKIGTWGPSALGRVQYATAKKNPPHLTCICPLVAGPQYNYDEYFPNGALRTEYVQQLDGLGFGMSTLLMQHPTEDLTWTFAQNLNFYPDSIRVPCFMIGGWYDHNIEVMLDFFDAIQTRSPVAVRQKHKLLMGPWAHGGHGSAQVGTPNQGQLNYPNANGWNDSLALKYFDFYLRGINNDWEQSPAIQYYQMGENQWHSSSSWPPPGGVNTDFYFHSDGALKTGSPVNQTGSLNYTYNPSDPSPTVGGTTLRADLDQGPYDQAPIVESRNDIISFTTEALTQDVRMRGNAAVYLKVFSNRRDTDFNVRLTDVYPDGRSVLVHDGVMRMRFRNGTKPADTSLIVPGTVYDAEIELPATALTFLAGHKIRVNICSSNYPRFNRNMNTGGNMYPGGSLDSLFNPLIADNTVYTNSVQASYITLPLVGFNGLAEEDAGDLKVFPNPVTDLLKLEWNGGYKTIRLFNAMGVKLLDKEMLSGEAIDFSLFSRGIYMVELSSAEQVQPITRKVIH